MLSVWNYIFNIMLKIIIKTSKILSPTPKYWKLWDYYLSTQLCQNNLIPQTSRLVHWLLHATALSGNIQLSFRSVSQSLFVQITYSWDTQVPLMLKVQTLWKAMLGGATHKPPRRTECSVWGYIKKHRSRENSPHSPSAPSSCQRHKIWMSSGRSSITYIQRRLP